jgi:hypothetical protein
MHGLSWKQLFILTQLHARTNELQVIDFRCLMWSNYGHGQIKKHSTFQMSSDFKIIDCWRMNN